MKLFIILFFVSAECIARRFGNGLELDRSSLIFRIENELKAKLSQRLTIVYYDAYNTKDKESVSS